MQTRHFRKDLRTGLTPLHYPVFGPYPFHPKHLTKDMANYSEKLKDPRWQKKRLEVLQRDNWTCQECFKTDKTLHVHHLVYNKGKDPWDYEEGFLITLCSDCHQDIEDSQVKQIESISREFKLKLKDGFIRDCCVAVFEKAENLNDIVYLVWECMRNDGEEEMIGVLTELFRKKNPIE